MNDPYYDSRPDANQPETFDILMDSLPVGRLQRSAETGDWVLTTSTPLSRQDVSIPGEYEERRAVSSALGWVEQHVENERPDPLED
jgi:hypothetical protein